MQGLVQYYKICCDLGSTVSCHVSIFFLCIRNINVQCKCFSVSNCLEYWVTYCYSKFKWSLVGMDISRAWIVPIKLHCSVMFGAGNRRNCVDNTLSVFSATATMGKVCLGMSAVNVPTLLELLNANIDFTNNFHCKFLSEWRYYTSSGASSVA